MVVRLGWAGSGARFGCSRGGLKGALVLQFASCAIRSAFKGGDYQLLLVANKFQTGFDVLKFDQTASATPLGWTGWP